jgi:hypothetical protein
MAMTPEEMEEAVNRTMELIKEAGEDADKIRALFPPTPRGFLLATMAIKILLDGYPAFKKYPSAHHRLTEWVIAGEPEELGEVPNRMVERMGEEQYVAYERGIKEREAVQ